MGKYGKSVNTVECEGVFVVVELGVGHLSCGSWCLSSPKSVTVYSLSMARRKYAVCHLGIYN